MSQQQWGAPPPPRRTAPYGRQPAPTQWPGQQPWPQQPRAGVGGQWSGQWASGQQQAPQNWPAPQPPRRPRGSGLGNAVRIVVAVVGVILVASFVRSLLAGPENEAQSPPLPGGAVPYQNEDYTPPPPEMDPPPVPGPRNGNAARQLVADNPLYATSVPTPTNCTMAALPANATPSVKQTHFNELMGCLMRVFADPVEQAGFTMPRPPVTVYTRPIQTACGSFDQVNAAYCTGDQRIYYAHNLLDAFPPEVTRARYAAELVLAHEYAHAVQARTAILISEKYLEDQARTQAAQQELSRRTEVQADCMAGQYVRSVAQSQQLDAQAIRGLSNVAYNIGDDVLSGRPGQVGGHGSGQARQEWFDRGVGSDAISTCNTFTAPSNQVR